MSRGRVSQALEGIRLRVACTGMEDQIGRKESIFLLQLVFWSDKSRHDGWVFKSAEEWEQELGIPYRTQVRLRENLKKRFLIEETYHRPSHKLFFRVIPHNYEALVESVKTEQKYRAKERKNDEEAPAKMAGGTCQNGRSIYHRVLHRVQKKNPLTPCQQGESDSLSPGTPEGSSPCQQGESDVPSRETSKGPSVFPANHDPTFPRAGGHEDWHVAVFAFDPENAAAVAALFPRCAQNWPPDLARKYVNLRRSSALSDRNLKLILSRYWKVSNSWEGSSKDDYTWKARTLSEFLTAKHLDLACSRILDELQDDLRQAVDDFHTWEEDEYRVGYLAGAQQVLESDVRDGGLGLLDRAILNGDPASFLIVGCNRPGAQDIRDQMRAELREVLCDGTGYLRFCREKEIDTKQLFGFSEEEIQGWHQTREATWKAKISALRLLLTAPRSEDRGTTQ